MIRKHVLTLALVLLGGLGLAVAMGSTVAQSAAAQGVNPKQLGKAGWDCLFVLGAVHCAPPGGLARVVDGSAETMTFRVFATTDPADDGADFLGTELIVRNDLFNGQPCPTDPPSGQYTHLLPLIGLNYWACHRYDSPF